MQENNFICSNCDRQGYAGKHYYDKGGPLKWQK